MVSLVSLVS